MCDPEAAPSPAARVGPQWRGLYAAVAVTGVTALAFEVAAPAGLWRTAVRIAFAAVAFATMALWVRREAPALEQAEWCACAASTVTVRVIPSARSRTPDAPVVDAPIPVVAGATTEESSPAIETTGVE